MPIHGQIAWRAVQCQVTTMRQGGRSARHVEEAGGLEEGPAPDRAMQRISLRVRYCWTGAGSIKVPRNLLANMLW